MTARVLVCGGRDYADRETLRRVLDAHLDLFGPFVLIHGAARGADTLAGEWAASRGVEFEAYPADWDRFGRRAGPERNRRMLHQGKPTVVVAFPGGAGTAHMVRIARAFDVPVFVVPADA